MNFPAAPGESSGCGSTATLWDGGGGEVCYEIWGLGHGWGV